MNFPKGFNLPVTEPFLTTAEIERIFSAEQRVQRMFDFEAALAVAQCGVGMMPADARNAIVACCRADRFDVNALLDSSRGAGNAAIPLVEALTRAVNAEKPAAGNWVHWGATSQDVLDTALILQLREASDLTIVADVSISRSNLRRDLPRWGMTVK